MWEPTPDLIADAMSMARHYMPREACGVVVNGRLISIKNRSSEKNFFAMDREEYFSATRDGGLEAIVHSHAYAPPRPSQADLAMCEATAVPWLIVSVPTETWTVVRPSGYIAPLIGRHWCHGSLDCWGVVKDGFTAFTGKPLPDFWRDWGWWELGQNTILDNVAEAGFRLLPQDTRPQHCDIVIMQFRSPVPNHLGLYIEPEGILLHQLAGRTSVREPYGGFFRQITMHIARHEDYVATPAPPHDPNDRSVWTGELAGQEPS